jgi:hypothetical protein
VQHCSEDVQAVSTGWQHSVKLSPHCSPLQQSSPLQESPTEAQRHWPLSPQVETPGQAPQLPLQPSLPQLLPVQSGVQLPSHCCVDSLHVSPAVQHWLPQGVAQQLAQEPQAVPPLLQVSVPAPPAEQLHDWVVPGAQTAHHDGAGLPEVHAPSEQG